MGARIRLQIILFPNVALASNHNSNPMSQSMDGFGPVVPKKPQLSKTETTNRLSDRIFQVGKNSMFVQNSSTPSVVIVIEIIQCRFVAHSALQ